MYKNMKRFFLLAILLLSFQTAKAQNVNLFVSILNGERAGICDLKIYVQNKIYFEYGLIFASEGTTPPTTCLFKDSQAIKDFQTALAQDRKIQSGNFLSIKTRDCNPLQKNCVEYKTIRLQNKALEALTDAVNKNKNIILRNHDGDGAERSYQQTVKNWRGRVCDAIPKVKNPSNKKLLRLIAITGKGRCKTISSLTEISLEEINLVLELEKEGETFGRGGKPILNSVAAPGASQHHSLLAVDVYLEDPSKLTKEDKDIIKSLNKFGWYRTVKQDAYHFTYLGIRDTAKLETLGIQESKEFGYLEIKN